MKSLKVLFLSLIIACSGIKKEDLKIVIDLSGKNYKKHLELNGKNINLDFAFFNEKNLPKSHKIKRKLPEKDYKSLIDNLEKINWEKIKERYYSKEAIINLSPPLLISIEYKNIKKNIIIIGSPPKELRFLMDILEPYLQIDFTMLR